MRVLFVCSRNRLRSPTAEDLFCSWPGAEVASAGVKPDADADAAEDLEWADLVLVMEGHKQELSRRFMPSLRETPVAVLGIPDEHEYLAPALVELLLRKIPPYLPGTHDRSRLRT